MTEPRDDEQLLEAIVAGDLDPDSPAVRERLHADPALAERARALLELASRVGGAGREERAVLREAAALESAPGEDRVATVVARELGARGRRGRFPWLRAAAAALVLALAAVGVRSLLRDAEPDWQFVGSSSLSPSGEVESFDRFTWTLGGSSWVLRVYPAGAADDPGVEPLYDEDVYAPEHVVPAEELATWPRAIYWTVTAVELGVEGESAAAGARLR